MRNDVVRAVVIALSGAAAVGGARQLVRFIARAIVRDFRSVIEEVVTDQLGPIMERTEQLVPNHGSSLADAIRRIEKRVGALEEEREAE